MKNSGTLARKDPFIRWMLLGIPILFILASPLHFLFEWAGKAIIAGLFTPVNESPWEHMKLTFWPILVWWLIGYLIFCRQEKGMLGKVIVTCAVAEVVSVLFILAFFYTYTGAFAIESLIIDIISLLLGLFFAILLARHFYLRSQTSKMAVLIAVLIMVIMAAAILYFTFLPPELPLFRDSSTGTYGIWNL